MKASLIFLCFLVFCSSFLPAQDLEREVERAIVIESPTAFTPYRGYFGVKTVAFADGGITTRIYLALNDGFFVGVNETVDGVIGDDKIKFQIPGVGLRVRVYGHAGKPSAALGYGYVTSLKRGRVMGQVIHGFYGVFSFPWKLWGTQKDLSIGFHFPFQPASALGTRYISFFSSFQFPFNKYLSLKSEVKNVFLEKGRREEILVTVGIRLNVGKGLGIGFSLDYASVDRIYNRLLTLGYQGVFY